MTLLRELIRIPTAVHKGDFVVKVTDAHGDPAGTLRDYVVTPQLARAFDEALGFVAASLEDGRSRASYLDGSFGSGKSHFMAVLDLLLGGDPDARNRPELGEAVKRHDAALAGKAFDLVPFHMLSEETLEAAIYEGYLRHLERIEPRAPIPAVFPDAGILDQADDLRAKLGDDAFFGALSGGGADAGAGSGWGSLAAASWDADAYARARAARPGDPERQELVSAIVTGLLPAFAPTQRGSQNYVGLEDGLVELARHAASRGRSALVFFLDELILWLGARMHDPAFVAREAQKIVKLVDSATPRSIPIVSFIARQRDLREFVGDHMLGADARALADALDHAQGRFHTISLADRNLPRIAERRVLQPRGAAERQALDDAFSETQKARPEVLNVLLGEDGTPESFRATYPFSPAFMAALVGASSALQRERTALKLMLQLLVDRRDELQVGDVVGVGDLYDVLASGEEPFSAEMRQHFDNARVLYREHLRPALLTIHRLGEAEAGELEASHPFRGEDRLVKTLLLAALVPETAPLRGLTVSRLSALNHGSIRSPLPGGEKARILQRLVDLHSRVAALRMTGDEQDPTVSVRLSGVDIDAIIERAATVDNAGARRQVMRALVLEAFGIDPDAGSAQQRFTEVVAHGVTWRGTKRAVDVVFGNIRDVQTLPDEVLRTAVGRWRVVIDYPFDQGHRRSEDLERLDRWAQDHGATQTVCWVPAFFTARAQQDLRRLVLIEHVLGGERLQSYAEHLSPQDRDRARDQLVEAQGAVRALLASAIRQAYGVEPPNGSNLIDLAHGTEDRLRSLQPGFAAQVPVGATMAAAFDRLVAQALEHEHPDHPLFGQEIRPAVLRAALEQVEAACETDNGRVIVPGERRRAMKQVAEPLGLGTQYEDAFLLADTWKDRLERAHALHARDRTEPATVGDVRRWIRDAGRFGLTRPVEDLVVLAYAAQSRRTFRALDGSPAEPSIDKLDDALELVATELPDEAEWETALARSEAIFGEVAIGRARTPAAVDRVAAALRAQARDRVEAVRALPDAVAGRLAQLGGAPDGADRHANARAGAALVDALVISEEPVVVVRALAGAGVPTSEAALGTSIAQAGRVLDALDGSEWELLSRAAQQAAAGDAERARILARLRAALERDQLADDAVGAVADAYREVVAFAGGPGPGSGPVPDPGPGSVGGVVRGVSTTEARRKLDELDAQGGEVEVTLSWTVTRNPA